MSNKQQDEQIPLLRVEAFAAIDIKKILPTGQDALALEITSDIHKKTIPQSGRVAFVVTPEVARDMQTALTAYLNQLTMDNKGQH